MQGIIEIDAIALDRKRRQGEDDEEDLVDVTEGYTAVCINSAQQQVVPNDMLPAIKELGDNGYDHNVGSRILVLYVANDDIAQTYIKLVNVIFSYLKQRFPDL